MKLNNTMMKVLFALLWFTALATSCKKGDPGPAGPQGIQGITGNDGNTILSGTGIPAGTAGKIGDYYLDISTSNLYGPKTASGWGNSVSLKGGAGPNGNGILSGNGIPSASLGVNGDFYLDKTTFNLYGPKTAGNWGIPTSLIGPAGPISYSELSFTDIKTQEARMSSTAQIIAVTSTSTWNNGNVILFKTNEGRYGKFRVLDIDIRQNYKLSISATVYNGDGTLKYADKTIVIEGTVLCDLDLGIPSTDPASDFHWSRNGSTTSLIARNTASFLLYK
jgi:hypothetical protein